MNKNSDLSQYYVDGDSDIKNMMEESYRESLTFTQQFWNEADIDLRFLAGDQTIWSQLYGNLPYQNRQAFQFNRLRRIINMVSGSQRKNRKTTTVIPIENADQQTADDFSALLQWASNASGAYQALSDAFSGALTTGFNLLSVWMDYRKDPINGDIKIDNMHHNGCMIDCNFKKKDLSDANFIWTRKWMAKKQLVSLLPGRGDEIEAMSPSASRDQKFMFLPENYNFRTKGLLSYDEFWYLDTRDVDMLIDSENGEAMEWTGDDEALELFRYRYPDIKVIKTSKQTCKLAVSVNDRVMYDGPNPLNIDVYPFVGVYGYFQPEIQNFSLKMQGMIRGLRDSQFLYNRRKRIELDICESQINSGLKFKESALVDPDDAFMTGQGRRLAIRDSSSMDDVQPLPTPDIPQGMFELSRLLGEEISQISGVNEELLGSADDDKSGVLSMLRQGAGLTTLQTLFDQLDDSQAQLGKIYMDIIQQNFSPAKVRRILGRDPTEEFNNKTFQKYDCEITEGVMTATQKQMQFRQLLELKELEVPIPDSVLIDAATLQNKGDLIKAIDAQQQAEQQQQQLTEQLQQQQQQVITESLMSKAESDKAMAAAKMNSMKLDEIIGIEKLAKAQEDRSDVELNRAKALKELADLDLQNISSILELLKSIQQLEFSQKEMSTQGASEPSKNLRSMASEIQNQKTNS